MAPPKGNRFWEQRSTHGRNPVFESPADLWAACTEYFEWVEANPLLEEKVFQHQGEIVRTEVYKKRAMTLGGLCVFLDISRLTWKNYCKKDDFVAVTGSVDEVMRDQKFAGAAGGLFNANIIARDLGLVEKQDINANVQASDLTEDQIDAAIQRKLTEYQVITD